MYSLRSFGVQIRSRLNEVKFSGGNLILAGGSAERYLPARNLFTKLELGVIQFENYRQNIVTSFKSPKEIELYKKKSINEFANWRLDEQRDKLKEFIFLIENREEDFKALKLFLIEYHNAYNNNVHNVKEFVFGTQIMRLFYVLNLPDEAVKFFKDSDLRILFEQMQTYKVLLSLLFENKQYERLFELYKDIRNRLSIYDIFPDKTINCLAFVACYQLNTPEHFNYAKDLWNVAQNVEQPNRSRYLLSGLALRQNDPKFALSLINNTSTYVSVRFIQLIAFTQLKEFDKAFEVLHRTIEGYKLSGSSNKPHFGKEMLEDLQKSIKISGSEEALSKYSEIYRELELLDLINDDTLSKRLCLTFPPMLPKNLFNKLKNKSTRQTEEIKRINYHIVNEK